MESIAVRAHIERDGVLTVKLPPDMADADVDAIVVVQRVSSEYCGEKAEPYSSLRLVRSLNLPGPADSSDRLEEFLYGNEA